MINVYDDNGNVIARVKYNNNLDKWDGSNWTSGSTGRHLGITRLKKSKQFVLIHGTQWQGEENSAMIISDDDALQHILSANNDELLNKYFPDYKLEDEEEQID